MGSGLPFGGEKEKIIGNAGSFRVSQGVFVEWEDNEQSQSGLYGS